MNTRRDHWSNVYATKAADSVSWYQASADQSLKMIEAAGDLRSLPVVDIGGGASLLVDQLLDRGFADITVLDITGNALAISRSRLGVRAANVHWIEADVLSWSPPRPYALWHDRAVFHFLTDAKDRAAYRSVLDKGLAAGGWLIIATFAEDGPERCSGLPVHRWSAGALAAELSEQFQLVDQTRQEHRTPGGGTQQFTWCRFKRL